MPQGDKSSYTGKQKRQAEHIEAGYEKKGISKKTAKARAWATVNKLTGGGKKRWLWTEEKVGVKTAPLLRMPSRAGCGEPKGQPSGDRDSNPKP